MLSLDRAALMRAPHCERRAQLEAWDLNARYSRAPDVFEDGEPLFAAVCEWELEGVVAKRRAR